jgi:hypothetical protein
MYVTVLLLNFEFGRTIFFWFPALVVVLLCDGNHGNRCGNVG